MNENESDIFDFFFFNLSNQSPNRSKFETEKKPLVIINFYVNLQRKPDQVQEHNRRCLFKRST